jgi:hypothetical protein
MDKFYGFELFVYRCFICVARASAAFAIYFGTPKANKYNKMC